MKVKNAYFIDFSLNFPLIFSTYFYIVAFIFYFFLRRAKSKNQLFEILKKAKSKSA